MTDKHDLFSLDVKNAIDALEVTSTERVVTDYWLVIDGVKFDAQDIYETLIETCSNISDSYINNRKMVEALKKLRVIEHGGHRAGMSAEKGPNYDYFMAWLRPKVERR